MDALCDAARPTKPKPRSNAHGECRRAARVVARSGISASRKKVLTPGKHDSCPPGGCGQQALKAIKDVKKQIISKEVNYEEAAKSADSSRKPRIIANQPVDRVESANLGSTIYYWHRAHKHPGIMGRSIVLRTETRSLMGGTVIKEAYRFATADLLPDAVFQPAPGLLKRVATKSSSNKPQR